MAQAILSTIVTTRGLDARIGSAGLLPGGLPLPPETQETLAALGYDGPSLRSFRSRQVTVPAVTGADLVLAMAREHVRELIVQVPQTWDRTFTLKELIRRGEAAGARGANQSVAEWLAKVGEGRGRDELLGLSSDDDVTDPARGSPSGFSKCAEEIQRLCLSLSGLLWPPGRPTD